jgi:hypothetical protein
MTDSRIKFVGSVYDQELLSEIRNNAYAYIHGHEVGGTNPSLLEALGSTKVNLLIMFTLIMKLLKILHTIGQNLRETYLI